MTTLDERARAAAQDLRRRAEGRAETSSESPARSGSRAGRRWLPAVAAVVVLCLAGGLFLALGDRDEPVDVVTSPEPPEGIEATRWSPEGLGLTVEVPAGWDEGGAVAGFAHSIRGEEGGAYVLATLVADNTDRTVSAYGEARRSVLDRAFDAAFGPPRSTSVDGRDAVVWDWELADPAGEGTAVLTEYVVDVGDGLRLLVDIGAPAATPHDELRGWIGATLRVDEPEVDPPSTAHPEPADAPAGIDPITWSPDDLGVSVDVPESWAEGVAFDHGFDHAVSQRGDLSRTSFVLAARMPAATGAPDARAATRVRNGARAEATAETTVAGRPARITRYRLPVGATDATQVEYVVDLGDGTFAVLVFGYPGPLSIELTEWIRSTVRVEA